MTATTAVHSLQFPDFSPVGVQRNLPQHLREKPNLLSQINLICPVQSHLEKFFASPPTQISNTSRLVLSH